MKVHGISQLQIPDSGSGKSGNLDKSRDCEFVTSESIR
jgi:hypothetical protein